MSNLELEKTTHIQEDIWQNQCSQEKLDAETGLPMTELLRHKAVVDQKSDHEKQFNTKKDVSGLDSAASRNTSEPHPPCTPVDILDNDENDFLELQKANNIMRAAYKEFMSIAVKAKTWVFGTPVVGSIEGFLEMFHTPPHHGSRVECSIESAILPISPQMLISIMMDGERWASTFSHIVSHGSSEVILSPLSTSNILEGNTDVTLVDAEFRFPAVFLPRWSVCFVRFKKVVMENIWAIVDVSSDYFKDTTSDSSQRIEYKRRPSGVIIRKHGFYSEVIWIENAEVQEFDVPGNMYSTTSNSNFSLSAKRWVSILLQNLKRSSRTYMAVRALYGPRGINNLLTIAETVQRVYLETVNPFPGERTCDLLSNDKIRIFEDIRSNCTNGRSDYIASSTFHIPETPIKLFHYLAISNMKFQWLGINSLGQREMVAEIVTEDYSNCITLHMHVDSREGAFEDREFFLQEASLNDYCSFIVSSRLTGSDVRASLLLGHCKRSEFLKPSGFAIMPAGPGGLQSEASLVTVCIRRELDVREVDKAIKAMSCHMQAVIGWITHCQTPYISDGQNFKQYTAKSLVD